MFRVEPPALLTKFETIWLVVMFELTENPVYLGKLRMQSALSKHGELEHTCLGRKKL